MLRLSRQKPTPSTKKMKALHIFFLLLAVKTSHSQPNVALDGSVTQSSRLNSPFSAADNAIDGNRNTDFFLGSCTATKEETNPWWRVDLLRKHVITSIVIVNRADCCHDALSGAEVHVGDSLINNGNDNPVVGVLPTMGPGQIHTIDLPNCATVGRYVNVLLPCVLRSLSLCEVEVYGYPDRDGENLALGGVATQSSVYNQDVRAAAINAIDGNFNADYSKGSCQHTDFEMEPWWRLDLLRKHKIFSIRITNRAGSPERLNGASVLVGNSLTDFGNSNPSCALNIMIGAGATVTFDCNLIEGRYVNIVIPGRSEYLHVCEVEVFGLVIE